MATLLAFFGAPGPVEMMVIAGIAVLLFGKRLPEVGRSLGKGIVEFKKGIRGIEDELETASSGSSQVSHDYSATDYEETAAPKFEPPTSEPKDEPAARQ